MWRHLDRARRVLAKRGANTVGYDELRPHVQRAATDVDAQRIDDAALDAAKRAIAELKLAVPGADWVAIANRTDGLVHVPLGAKAGRGRYAVGAVIAAFVLAVFAWTLSIVPEHKVSHVEKMRRELNTIVQHRKDRIAFLQAELGDRCLTPAARDLVQQLVQDGRGPDARRVGDSYLARCGPDDTVARWAHAPSPGHWRTPPAGSTIVPRVRSWQANIQLAGVTVLALRTNTTRRCSLPTTSMTAQRVVFALAPADQSAARSCRKVPPCRWRARTWRCDLDQRVARQPNLVADVRRTLELSGDVVHARKASASI